MRIICAGSYRSGSTWQYNAARTILDLAGMEYTCGDPTQVKFTGDGNEVMKTHDYRPNLLLPGTIVLTTIRDIRDIAASAVRRGWFDGRLDKCLDFLAKLIEAYHAWKKHTHCEMRYEYIRYNKVQAIKTMCYVLNLSVDAQRVNTLIDSLEIPKDGPNFITHLWPNHITDGEIGTYRKTLNDEWIRAIEDAHKGFIQSYTGISISLI